MKRVHYVHGMNEKVLRDVKLRTFPAETIVSTVSQQIFGAFLFSAVFGLVMFGEKKFAAEILFLQSSM